MSVHLRRAEPDDVDFLVELANHPEVEPFMGARRARDADAVRAQVERSQSRPEEFGRLVIEADGERAGVLGYELVNERNGIAQLEALALHPCARGRGVADAAARRLQRLLLLELGFHRLQLECYAFNERAIRHAERAGFVREGVKRKAYHRHGEWVDAVLFGLVREDVEPSGRKLLEEHVAGFNAGVRSGDFGPMLGAFADDAELVFEGVPVGPFAGRDAIAAAYRQRPPGDEIDVLDVEEGADGVVAARYAWRREPGKPAGTMILTPRQGRIGRLVVSFEDYACGARQ